MRNRAKLNVTTPCRKLGKPCLHACWRRRALIGLYARYAAVIRIQFKNRIIRTAFFTTDRIMSGFGTSGEDECQCYKCDLS